MNENVQQPDSAGSAVPPVPTEPPMTETETTAAAPRVRRGRPPRRRRDPNAPRPESFIERLQREKAELERQLAAVGAKPVSKEPPRYETEYDPLFWIDEDTQLVHLIGRLSSLRIRRGINDNRGRQEPIYVQAVTTRQWGSCPFVFKHRLESETANLKTMHLLWHVIPFPKSLAVDAANGLEPAPKRVVISPAKFKGVDYYSSPRGEMEPSSGIALREAVRLELQRNPEHLFLDTDVYHELVQKGWINKAQPNPYGRGVSTGNEFMRPTVTGPDRTLEEQLAMERGTR